MATKTVESPVTSNAGTTRPSAVARSAVPYYVAAIFAAAAMAWYLFVFVPSKLEYFVGLKLRALAVAAGHVKSRAENLSSALLTAPCDPDNDDSRTGVTATYLRTLVPDIQLSTPYQPKPAGLRLPRIRNVTAGAATIPPRATTPVAPPGAAPKCNERTPPPLATADVPWEGLVTQAAAVSAGEFDDLIVALPTGDVVWQRENTTPRLGNLAQVLEGGASEQGWFSFNWSPRAELPKVDARRLPTAVVVKPVTLGGRANLLLVQAVTLSSDTLQLPAEPAPPAVSGARETQTRDMPREQTLHVAGLVSMAALRGQAMNIPVAWVVALSIPVVVLFLALPFVKLATLTPRERFGFVDALLLLVATLATAGLAATIPLTQTTVDDTGDTMLSTFGRALQSRIKDDVSRVQSLAAVLRTAAADEIEPGLENCEVQVDGLPLARCNLWAALDKQSKAPLSEPPTKATASVAPAGASARPLSGGQGPETPRVGSVRIAAVDLDVVIWLDALGKQIDKWTTKVQVTGLTTHSRFQHYRDLSVNRLWSLDGGGGQQPFTIEPLRTPTTAELGVVVAFRLDHADRVYKEPKQGSPDRRSAEFLAFNIRPPSLLDAVVPPGFGFAVITQDGKVLFHSQENLSLEENFFEEVGESAAVRARAQSGRVVSWTGDYHGRPHRIHLERLAAIDRCPWRIVTFRQLGPAYAAAFSHQGGTFRLAALNLLAILAVAFGVWLWTQIKRRDARDLLNVRTITQPAWLWGLVALAGIAALLVFLTYMSWAGPGLNAIYVFFVVLPFLALWISSRARKPVDSVCRVVAGRALVRAELLALVVLVAALPAIGFARLTERVQTSRLDERLLEETQGRISTRHERMLARVNGPGYPPAKAAPADTQARIDSRSAEGTADAAAFDIRRIAESSGFARGNPVADYAYLDFVGIDTAEPPKETTAPQTGQGLLRFLLEWNPLPSRDLAGKPAMGVDGDRFRLESSVAGFPALTIHDSSLDRLPFANWTPFSAPPLKGVFGVLLLAATIAAVIWAFERLLADAPRDAPSLDEVLNCLPKDHTHGVMLIGAPRTNKDSMLGRALAARNATVALRIRLLEADAQPEAAEAQLNALASPRLPWWQRLGGRTVPAPGRVWIDVSNFETHLVDRERRKLALRLLERLLEGGPREMSRVVVVTTNVDPVAHFEEVFDEERKGIYADAMPEVELSRFAVMLTRFHRCYVPFRCDDASEDPWWNYDKARWLEVLKWETRSVALAHVRLELRKRWARDSSVGLDDLSRAISHRAAALYQLLWTSCTRREKLVLVQLAQEGFVTPQSAEVVAALIAKGLIVLRPGPAIFNYTFRAFLRRIERAEVVREWERMEGHGLWVVAGRLIASSLVAGGLFFLLTQGYSVEGLLPVLSGTGVFGVPLIRNLIARFSSKGPSQTAAA